MNFSFFVSKRYISSTKKKNIVNIISYISILGVSIGTAALVIILSVFNGFEQIVLEMYNSFDPHIKVSSSKGKTFEINDVKEKVLDLNDVKSYSFTLHEKVLMQHKENEAIVEIKGVDENFQKIVNVDSILIYGDYFYGDHYIEKDVLLLGAGIMHNLSIDLNNLFSKVTVTFPQKDSKYIKDSSDIQRKAFTPLGVFSVQSEYDNRYCLSPLKRVQKLLDRDGEASFLEISLRDKNKIENFKIKLQKILGEDYEIKTRIEQHQFLYKLLNSEKLAVFIILTFILIIASFNIISSTSMLMIEKKSDISVLWSLGASRKQIIDVFFLKGFLEVLFGSFFGIFLGILFSVIQLKFGIISMQGNFVVSSYPVFLNIIDILIVQFIVIIIGLVASYYPSKVLVGRFLTN